ncbi:MAG: UbiA family prenyltransferase [Desulfobaccales bacterium]
MVPTPAAHPEPPLCVDLDGTLVRTDTLLESLLILLKSRPWLFFLLPIWLLQGRAATKRRLAELVDLPVDTLPYHQDLLRLLRDEGGRGRTLVLATGADERLAQRVAKHLGCFSEVLASDGRANLTGRRKAQALVARFGSNGFDYAGNDRRDLPVWRHARRALLVAAPARLVRRVRRFHPQVQVVGVPLQAYRVLPRALRVYQWLKNLLVLVPLVAAHHFRELALWGQAGLAFLSFSLVASGIYLINDLLDLEADRRHHQKRFRPLAAGELPLTYAPPLALVLLGGGFLTAGGLPWAFSGLLGLYVILSLLYSLYVKRLALMDVCLLALLYTIRIFAGGEATRIVISYWLLTFSLFFFLSLAFLKRWAELQSQAGNPHALPGRGYSAVDLEAVAAMGTASGYIAVLVFALYINSTTVAALYRHPHLLWLIIPLLLYWVSRLWLLARRGEVQEDPILFALKDRGSYAVAALFGGIFLLAR